MFIKLDKQDKIVAVGCAIAVIILIALDVAWYFGWIDK